MYIHLDAYIYSHIYRGIHFIHIYIYIYKYIWRALVSCADTLPGVSGPSGGVLTNQAGYLRGMLTD
jgi:hypothetical protein